MPVRVIQTECSNLIASKRIYPQLAQGRVVILSFPKVGGAARKATKKAAKKAAKKAKPRA